MRASNQVVIQRSDFEAALTVETDRPSTLRDPTVATLSPGRLGLAVTTAAVAADIVAEGTWTATVAVDLPTLAALVAEILSPTVRLLHVAGRLCVGGVVASSEGSAVSSATWIDATTTPSETRFASPSPGTQLALIDTPSVHDAIRDARARRRRRLAAPVDLLPLFAARLVPANASNAVQSVP